MHTLTDRRSSRLIPSFRDGYAESREAVHDDSLDLVTIEVPSGVTLVWQFHTMHIGHDATAYAHPHARIATRSGEIAASCAMSKTAQSN